MKNAEPAKKPAPVLNPSLLMPRSCIRKLQIYGTKTGSSKKIPAVKGFPSGYTGRNPVNIHCSGSRPAAQETAFGIRVTFRLFYKTVR
jgi:hypothetical protein